MEARLTLLTVLVVAMAGLLALHIADPCNRIWPDAGNCLVERLHGEADDSSAETSAAEPEQPEEVESEPTPPPEPDPVPEGEASGDDVVSCGASSCSQDASLVYPIEGGDACVRDGVLGTWEQEPQQATAMNFPCEPMGGPPMEELAPDGGSPVACVAGECRQGTGTVSAPRAGESCEVDTDVPGTWTTVEIVAPGEGTIWRCFAD